MAPPLSSWPWASLGQYKYLLFGPLVWKVAQEWREQGALMTLGSSWCLHLVVLFAVRGLTYQFWFSYGNMLFFTRRRRVVADGVDFRQVDAEWDWDNFLLLQTLIGATVMNSPLLPGLRQLCLWDPRGWAIALLLHVGFSEPVFYLAHRALHRAPLFSQYHAAHHSSGVTNPLTGTECYGPIVPLLCASAGQAEPSRTRPNPDPRNGATKPICAPADRCSCGVEQPCQPFMDDWVQRFTQHLQ